jgi:hypothetical protein
MTRRKGETHHAALPAEKGASRREPGGDILRRRGPIGDTAHVFPRCDDTDFVVFCFAKPEDAEAIAKRFGGERLPMTPR